MDKRTHAWQWHTPFHFIISFCIHNQISIASIFRHNDMDKGTYLRRRISCRACRMSSDCWWYVTSASMNDANWDSCSTLQQHMQQISSLRHLDKVFFTITFTLSGYSYVLVLPVLSVLLPLELYVYLRLITGTLFLCISAHLTVLLLSNPVLNLIFLLLPITSSHSHTSTSDSTFDYWRDINISLTLTLRWQFGFDGRINEVNIHQAGLMVRWVTVCKYTASVFNQTTQANSTWPSLRG